MRFQAAFCIPLFSFPFFGRAQLFFAFSFLLFSFLLIFLSSFCFCFLHLQKIFFGRQALFFFVSSQQKFFSFLFPFFFLWPSMIIVHFPAVNNSFLYPKISDLYQATIIYTCLSQQTIVYLIIIYLTSLIFI